MLKKRAHHATSLSCVQAPIHANVNPHKLLRKMKALPPQANSASSGPTLTASGKSQKDARKAKLSKALKSNMARRKEQARAQAAGDNDDVA